MMLAPLPGQKPKKKAVAEVQAQLDDGSGFMALYQQKKGGA